jgi:hypothetical protein
MQAAPHAYMREAAAPLPHKMTATLALEADTQEASHAPSRSGRGAWRGAGDAWEKRGRLGWFCKTRSCVPTMRRKPLGMGTTVAAPVARGR